MEKTTLSVSSVALWCNSIKIIATGLTRLLRSETKQNAVSVPIPKDQANTRSQLSFFTLIFHSRRRIHHTAHEENAVCTQIPYQKKERVVGVELGWGFWWYCYS